MSRKEEKKGDVKANMLSMNFEKGATNHFLQPIIYCEERTCDRTTTTTLGSSIEIITDSLAKVIL